MSIPLPIADLTGLVAGNTGNIQLRNLGMSANPSLVQKPATLRMHNDSGDGLLVSFKVTAGAFYLPSGGWVDVQVDSAESEIDYQVTYVLLGAQVNKLQVTYYTPNEKVPPMTQLGNSPVGVSGAINVNTAQSLDNEGNVAATQWLKVVQAGGGASNLFSTVDGNFQIQQWDGASLKNLFHSIPNASAGNSSLDLVAAGLFARVLGQLILANASPLMSFDSGGNKQNLLQVNNFNQGQIFGINGSDIFQFLDHNGVLRAVFDLVNGLINIKGTDQTKNGSTSGTWDVYEAISCDFMKIVTMYFNGYKNAGGANTVTLKTPFVKGGFCVNLGGQGFQINNGGGALNFNIITALATSGGTIGAGTSLQQFSFAQMSSPFTNIVEPGANALTLTGHCFIVGF